MIRQQSANDLAAFRDFDICRDKVTNALLWLKTNNRYYKDVIINHKILQSLPKNSSIVKLLPQLQNDEIIDGISVEESEDDRIVRIFVPSLTLTCREDIIINDTLNRSIVIEH